MSARDRILKRLRQGQPPFPEYPPVTERRMIVPMDGVDLLERFIQQAEALSAHVYAVDDPQAAIAHILEIIGADRVILGWDFAHIPLPDLAESLHEHGITVADARDGTVRVGITGAEVALAATGSLVLSAKTGKPRSVSLLPYVHIAVIRQSQIMPHFEAWIEEQTGNLADFRETGNHIVITGASRTADIGMELVLGAHGPAQLHIIIVPD